MNEIKKKLSLISRNICKYQNEKDISQDVLSKKAHLAFYLNAIIEAGAAQNTTIDTIKNSRHIGVTLNKLMK